MAIVFIHGGYSPYLEVTLRQARAASPESEIVLLGDATNDRFPFLTHVDASRGPYRESADRLAAVYEHRSTNGEAFERVCFERWYRLRAWMAETGEDRALVLDSDVMLYAPEAEMVGVYGGGALALSIPPGQEDAYRWSASPHASLWTADALGAFCDATLGAFRQPAAYEEKWAYHRRTGTPGGVCDMTALYLFARDHGAVNTAEVREGATVDHNLNVAENAVPEEYAMEARAKALTWREGQPWGQNLRRGEPVRFRALHLQGQAKRFCGAFYRGPEFEGLARLAAQLKRTYTARALGGRVKSAVLRGAHALRTLTGGGRS